MYTKNMTIAEFDADLWSAMEGEWQRQEEHIELIASENNASPRVLQAQGSVLTNKYAEGYPGKRYYGGCEHVDVVEQLAIDRAKELFGADFAHVQPHSGSQANGAVYLALCQPGDTIMGMSLAHGGHLTHGASVNVSGRIFNAIQYGLNSETGEIDYDEAEKLALEHKPKLIIAGFSAYPRELDYTKFRDIADEVDAVAMADMAHIAGLIAGGVAANPLDAGFEVIYTGLHQTPEMVVQTAIQEDVDAVSLSILSGAHMYLLPRVIELLQEQGAEDVKVFGGGIVPDDDVPKLKEAGVLEIFRPGARTDDVIQWVRENIPPRAL